MKRERIHVRIAVSLLLLLVMLFSIVSVSAAAVRSYNPNEGYVTANEPWWRITYIPKDQSEDGIAKLNVMLKTNYANYASVSKEALEKNLRAVLDVVYEIAYDCVFDTDEELEVSPTSTGGESILPDIDLSEIDIAKLEQFLRRQMSEEDKALAKEKFDALMSGEYDHIIEVAIDRYVNDSGYTHEQLEAKASSVMEDIVEKIYDDHTPEQIEEKKLQSSAKVTEIVTVVKEAHESGESITFEVSDLKSIESLSVNDKVVFENAYFNTSSIKELISELPRPSELKNTSDEEMSLDYRIRACFIFGSIEFDLKIGFFGDCELIRAVAAIVDEYVDFSYNGGDISIAVTVPDGFSRILSRAIASDEISDDIKHKIFSLLSKNGDDVHAFLKDFSLADLKELLLAIDIKGLLDRETVRKYVNLDNLTNEEIVDKLDKYEGYYNKALDIVSRLLDKVPERFMQKTLFDAYDGDGLFEVDGKATVNIENALRRVSDKYGALVAAYFEMTEVTVSANVSISFENVNRVTYMIDGTTVHKDGFLPENADIIYFASKTEHGGKIITGWMDGSGELYSKMPDKDIVLYPYYGGYLEASVSGDVDTTYNPENSYTLSVDEFYIPLTQDYSFTYQWYKDGEAVIGATSNTLTVKYVLDSGRYYCKVTVTDGAYSTTANSGTLDVTVRPATIDITGVAWDFTTDFVYNGEARFVRLLGLPSLVTPTYTTTDADSKVLTEAPSTVGIYTTTVSLSYDRENYSLVGNSFAPSIEWEIVKATYDMSGVSFNNKIVYYNGLPHTISIEGTLPAGVSVGYMIGNTPFVAATEVGEYNVVAVFVGDSANYNAIPSMTAKLTVLADTPQGPDTPEDPGTTGGKTDFTYYNQDGELVIDLKADKYIPDGTALVVIDKSGEASGYDLSGILEEGKRAVIYDAYDIHFTKDGSEVTIVGNSFTVRMLIPEKLRAKETLQVIHIDDEGAVTVVEGATRDGDYMVFDTTHFSVYAIVAIEDEADLLWLWIVILAVALLIIILVLFRRSPKKGDGEEGEKPESDGTDGENAAELNEEEAPVEETPTEETATEEAPVEETPTEETPTEETPTEVAPAEEALVEETPTEEAPKEKSDAVAPVVINADDDSILVDGNVVYVRYRSSFMSRLIQTDEQIQNYYTVIKNHVLSYKGIKSRTSWNYEAFNKGRVQLVRLNIKGKALIANLALDPKDFSESKYHFQDMSSDKKLAEIPLQMKVKSDRALKYTLELIDVLMANLGFIKGDTPEVDYRMPYEPNSELAKRGLVKVILPAGVKLSGGIEIREADVGAVIGSGEANEARQEVFITEEPKEAPVEEAPVEEAPVEEAPTEEIPAEAGIVNELDAILVRYRSSFTSRLIQSGETTQDYYSTIKNYVLSFKGVKSRTSWNYETFTRGRVQCVRLNIKGKTLTVNLALLPENYNATKYHFTDVSDDPKLEKLPMQMKVRSQRALKYALELIRELLTGMGLTEGELPAVDYRMPYEPNEELAKRGLMKIILPKGVKSKEGVELRASDLSEIFNRGEKPHAEEAPIETAYAEEAPKEATPLEETSSAALFTDAKEADEIIADEVAESTIEHVSCESRSGKLAEVNIEELCQAFKNGETVTLAELKRRGVVGARFGRVKILAGGRMTKSLTVVADKFSLQAVKMITLAGGTVKQID